MPTYEENIDPAQLSATAGESSESMQRLAQSLQQVNSHLDSMTRLMGTARDYTQDELKAIREYQTQLKATADLVRSMNAEQVKGMDDYSVAVKAAEDRINSLNKMQKDGIDARKKAEQELQELSQKSMELEEKNAKLKENLNGRLTKEKRAALEKETGLQGENAQKLRRHADRMFQDNAKEIRQSHEKRKIAEETQKQAMARIKSAKDEALVLQKQLDTQKDIRKLSKTGQGDGTADPGRRRRDGRGINPLEILSDLHIPGLSHAATVAKYGRRGVEEMGEGAGTLMKGVGGLRGGLLGTAVAGLGYTAMQGYRVYDTGQQMAPIAKSLAGQMGAGSVEARQQAIGAYGGYGGIENLQTLQQLNRQIGGAAGMQNLRKVTDIANRYGMERGEAVQGLGQAFNAGVAPERAGEALEKIMAEGVKSGIDRARITQFTQEVLGVQKEIFRMTGQENTQNIAQAFARFAGGQGESFLRGPGMAGIQGLDQAVRSAGRGNMQGPALGTLYRAFGFGAGGDQLGADQYYGARKKMEGGIFQGSANEIVGNVGNIIKRFTAESGGNEQIANLRMADELGIGLNQVESLRGISSRAEQGGVSKEDQRKLQQIMEEQKDPMIKLLDIQAKSNENLAKLAGSAEGLNAIVKIDELLLSTQESALEVLKTIAGAIGGDTGDMASVALGALGLGALIPGAGKAAGGAAKGAARGLGGALTKLGPALPFAGAAAAGAAGGYVVGKGIDYGIKKFGSYETEGGETDFLEQGLAKLTPEWAGGITEEEYNQVYGPKKINVPVAPPRLDTIGNTPEVSQTPGAKNLKSETRSSADPANTEATNQNTQAVNRLTNALMNAQQRGAPMPRVNVR